MKNRTVVKHVAIAIPMIFLMRISVRAQLDLLEFKNYTHGFGCFNHLVDATIAASIAFVGFILFDYFTSSKYWKYIWIATQLGILAHTAYVASIYYDYIYNWDIKKHQGINISCSMNEYFILIIGYSLLLFGYVAFSYKRSK